MHFHVPPPNADGTRPSSRQMNAYTANLFGRRSRSQSRKGMNVLVDQLEVRLFQVVERLENSYNMIQLII